MLGAVRRWVRGLRGAAREAAGAGARRDHVVLLDGTLSSLEPGRETSIGLIWKMLEADGRDRVYYEPGIQWRGPGHLPELVAGVGINAQIQRAYRFLAESWRPDEPIFLMGYSRGAYAVRALAGMIDAVGLLRPEEVDASAVRAAYEHYRRGGRDEAARRFRRLRCHAECRIRAVGVLDTVDQVGVRWPVIWRWLPQVHAFRSDTLGEGVEYGLQALALHETRLAYPPRIWRTQGARTATVEQVWFRGGHADLGGHLDGFARARPLANVPAAWMLRRLAALGLTLPHDWPARFPADPDAPSIGTWRGPAMLFLRRAPRVVGADPSEALHPSAEPYAPARAEGLPVSATA
jgi:uncharacterized protein (DUF2235 family)